MKVHLNNKLIIFLSFIGIAQSNTCTTDEAQYLINYFDNNVNQTRYVIQKDSCLYFYENNEVIEIKKSQNISSNNEIIKFDGTNITKLNNSFYLGDVKNTRYTGCNNNNNNNNNS